MLLNAVRAAAAAKYRVGTPARRRRRVNQNALTCFLTPKNK